MKTWTDQFGVTTPINKLSLYHIQNIIKMLWRNNENLKTQMELKGLSCNLGDKSYAILYLNYIIDNYHHQTRPLKSTRLGNIEQKFLEEYIQEIENEEDDYYCGHYDDLPF